MAFLLTSALNANALIAKIHSFAVANGWTSGFNVTGHMGVSKGNCFAAIGVRGTYSRRMLNAGGTVQDAVIAGTLCTAFVGSTYYGSHTNSPGGSSSTSDNFVWTNDWVGPFSQVYLFSGPNNDWIHVIARQQPTTPRIDDRVSMISFGLLDNVGMTTPRCAFMTGMCYEFWENNASITSTSYRCNRPNTSGSFPSNISSGTSSSATPGHQYPFNIGVGSNSSQIVENNHFHIPAGVANTVIFPSLSPVVFNQLRTMNLFGFPLDMRNSATWNPLYQFGFTTSELNSSIGLALLPFPVFIGTSFRLPFFCIGEYPGVRYCDISNLELGEEFPVNGQTWVAFPFKSKSSEAAVGTTPGITTWKYGLAFLK